jgi:peptidoglycan/xylan/chitin deacetylase (PgdA/CDA1 family)/glycosyltransferase involved in cell wall biosynthesis
MSEELPFVSVVIPAFNEELMLPTCLQALTEQNYKGKYEIIVVDNNSEDLTSKIALVYGATVIKEKRQGVAFARQAGFSVAKGQIILSTDSDTIVPPNWISSMVSKLLKDKSIVAVGGSCSLIGTNTFLKMLSRSLVPVMFLFDKILDYPGTLQGWNFAVRKDAFEKIGGFDTTLRPDDIGEDRDLGKRLGKVGKVRISFRLQVKTSARRFVGLVKTLKYVFLNYFYFLIKKRSLHGTFQTIRQKPYETYDVVNDVPFFLTVLIFCLFLIMMLLGAIPFINIWSVSSVKTKDKVIALTFDKYSSNPDTEQVLQVLKDENVKATFFVTGNEVKADPGVVKEIYSQGNLIGNHASSQNVLAMLKTPSALIKDVNSTNDLIYKTIGVKPKFFRPTRGYRTIWGASSLTKYGYNIVTWNDTTNNATGKLGSKEIAVNVIKNARPGGIIDLTDSGSQTATATEEIIELLTADGYRFVTLDRLLQKPGYFSN